MKERDEEIYAHVDQDRNSLSPSDTADQPETQSRRDLIERYGKYALVAAPLFMFVSKARAIHSRP